MGNTAVNMSTVLSLHFPCYTPEPASLWLMLAFSPDNGDVEVNPEEDVDDEDGDEGLRDEGDVSFPLQLQPGITT